MLVVKMYTLFISTYSNLLTIGILKDDKLILKKKESIKVTVYPYTYNR